MTLHKIVTAAVRYGVVGATCALLNVGIIFVGTEVIEIGYILSALSTCVITIPISYVMHVSFSFEKKLGFRFFELAKFLALQFLQFFLGVGLMAVQIEIFEIRPWVAMTGSILLLYFFGFFLNSVWVFNFFNLKKP